MKKYLPFTILIMLFVCLGALSSYKKADGQEKQTATQVSAPDCPSLATNFRTTGVCNGTTQEWLLEVSNANIAGTNWHWVVDHLQPGASIYVNSPYSATTYVDINGGGAALTLHYTDMCGNDRIDGATVWSTCQ